MTPEDAKSLWEDVKANRRKIDECERHLVPGGTDIKLGQKHVCLNCRGALQLTDIGPYIQGYEAAGGQADDVWPGYRRARQ